MTEPNPADNGRSFSALPKPETEDAREEVAPTGRRGLFDLPDGALGVFFLLVLAALSGGLIAVYWPWLQNASESSVTSDKLGELETRVDQIAAGHAPKAAAAAFIDERRDLAAMKTRLDADEARLTSIEKATGQIDDVDLSALKTGIDKNTTGLAQLSDRVGRLETTPGAARGNGPSGASLSAQSLAQLRKDLGDRTQALNDSLGKLAARTAALEKNAPPADLAGRLDGFALKSGEAALELRIGKLEDQDMAGVMKRAASVLALADLMRASSSAEPFSSELGALKALVPQAPEVTDLSRYAATGVPTRTMLADRFSHDASAIVAAQRLGEARTWTERLWSNLLNLVSIRRVGDVPGDDAQARVARAEVDLHVGDLDRAVSEVSALKGSARAAASGWLSEAEGRLSIERDARLLSTRVVASLTVPQPATAPPLEGSAPAK